MIRAVKSSAQCIGCGSCERRCPQVFRLKYRAYSEVVRSDFEKNALGLLDAYYNCPVQAIEIEGDHPDLKTVWQPGRIIAKKSLTPGVMELRVQTPTQDFRPGQYVTLRLKDYLGTFNRAYSVVEVEAGVVTFCVTIMSQGRGGNFLRTCPVPCDVEVTAPKGDFHLDSTTNPKVFVATGTGLVPLLSMMASCPDAKKTLYFGQKQSADLFYLDRLAKIPNLEVKVCLDFAEESWTGYRGRVTDRLAADGVAPDTEVYACGSDPMLEGVRQVLEAQRVPDRQYHRESFSALPPPADQGGNWRLWVRHAHVFSSLALSVLFIFYGLTGFMASRPQLFPAEAKRVLPSNIRLQKAELSGYLKSRLPADVEVVGFAAEAGRIRVEFEGQTGVRYIVEIDPTDRNHTIAEVRRLPEIPADARALAETLARQYPGRLDADSIEADARFINFNLESVWAQTAVTVDKTDKTVRVQRSGTPWVVALINLHRGKQAGPLQRVLIDASGLIMVLVTLTGMAFALQSRVRSARWTAIGLIALSAVLAIFMLINR